MTDPGALPAIVEEAMKKAAIAWVSAAGGPATAVWCLPLDGVLYLVTGPGEQSVAGLAAGVPAEVTLRGDHGGRIVSWIADVTAVAPGSELWEQVAPALAGKRLNAVGDAAGVARRWADACVVWGLTPVGAPTEAGGSLPSGAQAEPVRPSAATRLARAPFRLHKVRQPKKLS